MFLKGSKSINKKANRLLGYGQRQSLNISNRGHSITNASIPGTVENFP